VRGGALHEAIITDALDKSLLVPRGAAMSVAELSELQRAARVIRAPRGPERTCKGWIQEAALRMLMNTLDPEVAEDPDRLVVYGGSGKAARTWQAFDAIVAALRKLGN